MLFVEWLHHCRNLEIGYIKRIIEYSNRTFLSGFMAARTSAHYTQVYTSKVVMLLVLTVVLAAALI